MGNAVQDQDQSNVARHPSSDAPLFLRIVNEIKRRIADGTLSEHAALPSERRLAEDNGISRMTARRALDALEAEGLVYSEDRRGRFVSPRRVSYDVSNMVSFVADAENRGAALEIEVIRAQTTAADAAMARRLDLRQGAKVHEYTRLFRNAGHPIFVETEVVDAARCPGFLGHDLHQSTTRLLETHYDLAAHTGDIVIRMRAAHAEETRLLGLGQSYSGIELTQVIRDANGRPFCLGRQFWRGEVAEFSARAIVKGTQDG